MSEKLKIRPRSILLNGKAANGAAVAIEATKLHRRDRANRFRASCWECDTPVPGGHGKLALFSDDSGHKAWATMHDACEMAGAERASERGLATYAPSATAPDAPANPPVIDEPTMAENAPAGRIDAPAGPQPLPFPPADADTLGELTVKELRERARALGFSGAALAYARQAELVEAIQTGLMPPAAAQRAAGDDTATVATAAGTPDVEAALKVLAGALAPGASVDVDQVREIVREHIDAELGHTIDRIEEGAKKAVEAATSRPIVVTLPDRPQVTLGSDEPRHERFEEILEALHATGKVALVGPAGTGKSTLARQLATALGREYRFQSCSGGTSEATLTGRMLFDGTFVGTPLLEAFEGCEAAPHGAVCLLDEADGLDPNAALCLHEGLSNGHLAVPNRKGSFVAEKARDFSCVLAMNTYGTGHDASYSGRDRQDAAFLDRFAGLVFPLDYDSKLEDAFAAAEGWPEGAELVRTLRANVERHRMQRTVGTRLLIHLARLRAVNPDRWTRERLIDQALIGWSEDEAAKAREGL